MAGRRRLLRRQGRGAVRSARFARHLIGPPPNLADRLIGSPIAAQDPVHGLIRLNGACIDIMDSQPFQRLRDLLRPDQHICARWLTLDATRLQAALHIALPQ